MTAPHDPSRPTTLVNAPDDLVGVVWVRLLPGEQYEVTYRAASVDGDPTVPMPREALARALHDLAGVVEARIE